MAKKYILIHVFDRVRDPPGGKMNDVREFIKMFQDKECNSVFIGDCSYWFATILYRRFIRNGAKIMFDVAESHFGTMVNGRIYDITGDVTEKYKWVTWTELQDSSVKETTIKKYMMF